ncbi:AAA-ATPase ASD, mitochondrial-like [Magnolia sinica]|uniref:AAA-ATPase ASD, mitochondrial-like n=1 Tax=Magnolia sinica TaxID=86752 RepID=UPI002659ECF4|nr:AAA-ATPase ASD, mitochondrial-like [Magnolia sinica]
MDDYEQVTDNFRRAKFWWSSSRAVQKSTSITLFPAQEQPRYYTLTFHRRHRQLVMEYYMSHVVEEGKAIEVRKRQRKLYTNNPSNNWYGYKRTVWSHVLFEHPATFETLAMDPDMKQEIIEDLETFRESKDYYVKIGKAWKRGYLLYGPPGTGKSTMIVAMANFLDYDVYDLELTAVKNNTELKKLLIETTSKSIMVIEDIDCSLDLSGKRKKNAEKSEKDTDEEKLPPGVDKDDNTSKVTLSGLLNFIDGLWSACGGERIIVFTKNHVEKLDPALIRKGRMDKHIELSYCSFEAFKVLAKNYLNLDSHPLFETVQQLIEGSNITPADVAEKLMPKSSKVTAADKANTCLKNLIQALHKASEEVKSKEAAAAAAQLEEKGDVETVKIDKDDTGKDVD